ncbi:hypothetical protein [Streptomyces antibioticus]|uniref:hypothetical protein n=1 Tax=Streptomyces antibioticus TaxID=1890 RepID=UPI0033AB832B
MSDDGSLLARIERYYATVQPGGAGGVTDGDIARVRARQRESGVPEAFEWLAEAAPDLRERIEPPD